MIESDLSEHGDGAEFFPESGRVRLFCFPHSGGGASTFRGWQDDLPGLDVLPILLPGREERAAEPVVTSMSELADTVCEALLPHTGQPFAFFGHSMGAVLGFEVALRLTRRGASPQALFVAGMLPPHRARASTVHTLPDEELLRLARDLGGIPAVIQDDPAMLESFLRSIRADTTALGSYQYTPGSRLSCPVVVFNGREDPLTDSDAMTHWAELTVGKSIVHTLPGGHFFVHEHRHTVTRLIAAELGATRPFIPTAPGATAADHAVAIVGMACRLPGAGSTRELWDRIVRGHTSDDIPGIAATARKHSRKTFGLADVAGFDAEFFGISPREAERMDPQQRLLLEVAWEALEDTCTPATSLAGTRTGVFVGQMGADYWELGSGADDVDLYTLAGAGLRTFSAGRLSYALDLRGPSVVVDTACSSSLTAAHLACRSLSGGADCDLALVAGVNLVLRPEYTTAYDRAGMLSERGKSAFADATADGFVRSDGVAVVVLKPLRDALTDGDRIYAVIAGSTVNNDGQSDGLMAPSLAGQERMLRAALADAGIEPSDVDYVEAHGPGTPAGDKVELAALEAVLGAGRDPDRPCHVGSVKAVVGHTEGAAGIVGLIKAALVLHEGRVPAVPLPERLNPAVDWERSAVRMPAREVTLPRPAVAGVSSFGLAGSNAHMILTSPPAAGPAGGNAQRPLVLPISARHPQALRQLAAMYADLVAGADETTAGATCAAAALGRSHLPWRIAVVGADGDELAEKLRLLGNEPEPGQTRRVAFVYSGQGSQWPGMARDLLVSCPVFRTAIDECAALIEAECGWSLHEVLAGDDTTRWQDVARVQPVLWAIQVALTRLWQDWGLTPDVVIGHSMGEVAAAHVAGGLSLPDAAKVICRRSRLMALTTGGMMAVVGLSPDDAAREITGHSGQVSVAAHNSPFATVLSGDAATLEGVLADLERRDIYCGRVAVEAASHSPSMDPASAELRSALTDLTPQPASAAFYSTLHGMHAPGVVTDAAYWADNLRRPVLFAETVNAAIDAGCTVFVEISPHPVLVSSIAQCDETAVAVGSLHRYQPSADCLAEALAHVYTAGVNVNWSAYHPGPRPVIDLPTYPWQHQHLWSLAENGDSTDKVSTRRETGTHRGPRVRVEVTADGGWSCVVDDGSSTGPASADDRPDPDEHQPEGSAQPPAKPLQDTRVDATELAGVLAAVLKNPAHRIPSNTPLRSIGVDSLMAAEFRARIAQRWGTDIPLSKILLGRTTLNEVAMLLSASATTNGR